jgi:hypothetical protein
MHIYARESNSTQANASSQAPPLPARAQTFISLTTHAGQPVLGGYSRGHTGFTHALYAQLHGHICTGADEPPRVAARLLVWQLPKERPLGNHALALACEQGPSDHNMMVVGLAGSFMWPCEPASPQSGTV